MTNKNTRRALFMSLVSLLLCFTMLLGTTFAWFTDSVSSARNTIKSGNLDVEFEYSIDMENWETVENASEIFTKDANWEPGYTEVVYLRVRNNGSLALKYQIGINIVSETAGTNKAGESFNLSDHIEFGMIEDVTAKYADRDDARKDVTNAKAIKEGFSKVSKLEKNGDEAVFALVVFMPETVGNEANYKTGTKAPEIDLGLNVFATQLDFESDSFGDDYDEKASVAVGGSDADYTDLATAIANVEDGGVVFVESGTYNINSQITITSKDVSVVGLGEVTLVKNFGNAHVFTVKNGANLTLENLTIDGNNKGKNGIYVRWNSTATLYDVTVKNTGGSDIIIDEASDVINGDITETTASYVNLFNSHIEDSAFCAAPTQDGHIDTYAYFNYDAASTVGSIEVQSINKKPENIIINGVASDAIGTVKYFNVTNDAELAAALETIKTNEAYWNVPVFVNMAAGTYSGDYNINQFPKWNGVVGAGSTANNYASGVTAGDPRTNITFTGETVSTYSLGAAVAPAVTFTGNVTVNGFGNSNTGLSTATSVTTFKNIAFDAANSADETSADDAIVMYVKAAASNVTFEGCTFTNATHITLGGSNPHGIGNVAFTSCSFDNGGCLSGYYKNLAINDCLVEAADNGFMNIQNGGKITVNNSDITAGRYFIRTSGSGVELTVTDSTIEMYESEDTAHLVYFRGKNESAKFTDCTITDGYTTAGVDADSTLAIGSYTVVDGVTYYKDAISGENILWKVSDDAPATIVIPEGVTTLKGKLLEGNTKVKEVVIPSSLTNFGGNAYDTGKGASGGFFYKSAVEKVVLPEGLVEIPAATFNQAYSLTEVNIPSTVTKIGINAFAGSGLTKLTLSANVKEIGYGAFRDMANLTDVTIEGNVFIPGYAFRACASLKNVVLNGENVTFNDSDMIFTVTSTNNENPNGITVTVRNDMIKARLEATGNFKGTVVVSTTGDVADENGIYTNASGEKYAYADTDTLDSAIKNGAETLYLDAGTYNIPDSAKGKTLTINGTKDAIVAAANEGEDGQDYGLDGSTVTFNGVTFDTTNQTGTYRGYARLTAVYNDCDFIGTYTLGTGTSEFNNCTFDTKNNYVWTWGASEVTFNNCTFDSEAGKAILVYGGTSATVTVNNCSFSADKAAYTYDGQYVSAVEIDNSMGSTYVVNFTGNNTVTFTGTGADEKGNKGYNGLYRTKNSAVLERITINAQ